VEAGGVILSACVSIRQNTECAEAWLFTAAEHRRKGLAQLVVTAWARDMMKAKLGPFYSHKLENIASVRLANKLGLVPVFEEIVIEKKT
jgi:predicted GNAT family acetyltransferase